MKQRFWVRLCAAAAVAVMAASCTSSSRTSETTGQYVDSSAITAKVKTALVSDSGLKGFQIGVETYKDVVQLSGFVDTPEQKARASQVASNVSGVRQVQNNLIVKQ